MHLCSAITWQLGGPRVQRANGGFLSSEIHLKSKASDVWPDLGGRGKKGILRLEFLLLCTYLDHFISLGCGGTFLILLIVYFIF